MDVTGLLGVVAGPIVSGVVGAVGGFLNQYMLYKNRKLDIELERTKTSGDLARMRLKHSHNKEILIIEHESREKQTALEGEIGYRINDLDNLKSAIEAEQALAETPISDRVLIGRPKLGAFVIILRTIWTAVQKLTRPVLTGLLVYIMWDINSVVMATARAMNGGVLSPEVSGLMALALVMGFIQLAATSVGYWFGSRPSVFEGVSNLFNKRGVK